MSIAETQRLKNLEAQVAELVKRVVALELQRSQTLTLRSSKPAPLTKSI